MNEKIGLFISTFIGNSGRISSKRVIAVLGCFICFGLLIASFITLKPVPEFAEMIFIGCLSLYGVDILPSFVPKINNKS